MATTKTDPKLGPPASGGKKTKSYEGLSREQLVQAYRLMYTSRRIDDREILLKRQQKIYFQMSGAGHEAIGVAAGLALKPAYDWFYPYYRDRALCLALGVSPTTCFCRGGRGRRSKFRRTPDALALEPSSAEHRDPVVSDRIAILQAVGCAEAGRYLPDHPQTAEIHFRCRDYRQFKDVEFHKDEVTYVSLGDGTSSEGEFWEAMNAAALGKLPVIFCVEDNGYAISVPVEVQTAGGKHFAPGFRIPKFSF